MRNNDRSSFGKRYQILSRIGEGGMGKVYKVHDTLTSNDAALKEMILQYTNSSALLRFKNEFRIMSQFQHPNTVKVFDYGVSLDNKPFIVMEFIDGKNLSEFNNLSIDQVADILIQLCQAAGYIHSRHYIHRDLKPTNIKYLADETIKLLDYGLISQVGAPCSGKISGTYQYLAPEVIAGGIIDESTDLYSIGILGYELLAGQPPFMGDINEILQGHLKRLPIEPMLIQKDIPASLNAVIMKLLEKNKEQRYRDSSTVLEDLQNLTGKKRSYETVTQKHGYMYSSKLFGREKQTASFKKLLSDLDKSGGASLFIGAPAGVGKTRLLNEFKTFAQLEGCLSIYLDAQSNSERIYGWVDDLVRQLALISDSQEIQHYVKNLKNISKDIEKYFQEKSLKHTEDEIVKDLTGWLTDFSNETPFILFIDDLHWMDLKSIQVLNELIRRMRKSKILFIAAFRNDEVDKTSPIWHTTEEELSKYIELGSLTIDQTGKLVEHILYPTKISDDFLNFCFRHSAGNVFDLFEFLRYLIDKGQLTKSEKQWLEPLNPETLKMPPSLEKRINTRMKKLNKTAGSIMSGASVLEDSLELEIWLALFDFKEDQFFDAVDELVKNQIIIKTDGSYQFSHAKLKDAVYNNLTAKQKKIYHQRAAEFYESKLPDDENNIIPIIARHYAAAQVEKQAVDYSLKAAEIAEKNEAEWIAFNDYRTAAQFLQKNKSYPNRDQILLNIYEKAAQFSSAAWIDASTSLGWLQKAIDHYSKENDLEKVFNLSLSYIVSGSITSNYDLARQKINEIIKSCKVEEDTLQWAVLFGAGVCLVDWYQGFQTDCFDHAQSAINIFEKELQNLPEGMWPAYSWALFWRDKARAYMGKPIVIENVEKIRQLMEQGKSDLTIYWHTLTAVGARAAFTGRYKDLLEWKQLASKLSQKMGKVYWFECWISHSYLYAALDRGEFSQIENHIKRVQASYDPYQVRLAYLFSGRWNLIKENYQKALYSFEKFFKMEEKSRDNSYMEGVVFLAKTYLETDQYKKAEKLIAEGAAIVKQRQHENPFYLLQLLRLNAELAMNRNQYEKAKEYLDQSMILADELVNPIQKGFVQKSFGILYQKQNKLDKAKENFSLAKGTFLSIGNKYQAGLAANLLESMLMQKRLKDDPGKVQPASSKKSKTKIEIGGTVTSLEDEDLQKPDNQSSKSKSEFKTEIEDEE